MVLTATTCLQLFLQPRWGIGLPELRWQVILRECYRSYYTWRRMFACSWTYEQLKPPCYRKFLKKLIMNNLRQAYTRCFSVGVPKKSRGESNPQRSIAPNKREREPGLGVDFIPAKNNAAFLYRLASTAACRCCWFRLSAYACLAFIGYLTFR